MRVNFAFSLGLHYLYPASQCEGRLRLRNAQINLILLNICLAQLRKHKFFLNIRSLIFGISLGLTSSSSFSLAEWIQAKLDSCSLMRQLHYSAFSEDRLHSLKIKQVLFTRLHYSAFSEGRLRLGKMQVTLLFRSACTTFAALDPPSLLTMLKSGVVFLYIPSWQVEGIQN